jgi:CHAD domain-containing protein
MMIDELIEHVVALEAELQACSARLQEHSDGEALHDLRIGVRRLRSILRPLRGLPEINALELVAAEVGHRSTPLRDTEVLIQELEAHERPDLIEPRQRELEAGREALLASSEWLLFRNALAAWPAICREAAKEGKLKGLRKHIRRQLAKQQRKLAEGLRNPAHDRHRLRVLIKRVRYAYEVYPKLSDLPDKAPKRLKAAQSVLGDWHDCVQWLHRAEQEPDLQPLCETWREAMASAERHSDQVLKRLLKDFPKD